MTATSSARLHGTVDEGLAVVAERLDGFLDADPDLSFQVAAFARGRLVLDAWGGPHLSGDSLIVPFSVSKNAIGLSVGLLIQRGQLDLDEPVAAYWPEFAAKGKQAVTVRQLLSHQAGLPQATPSLTWAEILDDHAAAERLAASRPFWHPGSAFGYHAVTIGSLASELVFRVTGRTLQAFYDAELREPLGADFFLGLPSALDDRRAPVLPMVRPESDDAIVYTSPLLPVAMTASGPALDPANDDAAIRFGHPAVSGIGSAHGIARLLAGAVTGIDGAAPLLDADTVEVLGQQQVRGYDEVLGQPNRAHAVVFQKPSPSLPFGGPRAFGHDGAAGALAVVDPDEGFVFAWTIARGPWPGGADPRALALARELPALLT